MPRIGKVSAKKGKTSYTGAIIGVAVVLFLFGIVGWFFLNIRKTGDYFKESIQVHTYLNPDAGKKKIDSLTQYISSFPYANRIEYVDKEKAAKIWNAENDTTWKQFLTNNPLPESIDFYVKADHVEKDSLDIMSAKLQAAFPGVISEFQFPTETVTKVSSFVKTAALIFLFAGIILTIIVVFSIDNTIRLDMYSNRFIIKTMQMVGATRGFIAKPIDIRAIINGLIAAAIAIAAVWGTVYIVEGMIPSFKVLHDNTGLIWLSVIIILLGVTITVVSTHRSVIKYLKMKLDDLY